MKKLFVNVIIACYGFLGAIVSKATKSHAKKVVLNCNKGLGYLCNPKYIAEALERLYPGQFSIYVLVRKRNSEIPSYVTQVPYHSLNALYHLATAQFTISNARFVRSVPKREDQYYIQTWHGSLSPKKVEKDAGDNLPLRYQRIAEIDGKATDFMFANNDYMRKRFEEAFWFDGPVIRCGYPRHRPYIIEIQGLKERVYKKLGIPEGKKIVLYAPTFRNDYSLKPYSIDAEACCDALERRFGGSFVFVWRLHPNFSQHGGKFNADTERSYDGTSYFDAQELIAASDVLITDYSSTIDDFVFTSRPAFMFATDIDEYVKERGFYYPLTERPYDLAKSMPELINCIEQYDFNVAAAKMKRYFEKFDIADDGKGDEDIAQLIYKLSFPGVKLESLIKKNADGSYSLIKDGEDGGIRA